MLATLAQDSGRRLMVRLVKGAYWDSEIKRAQVAGRPAYPVFTTKAATDLSYLVCARSADRRAARISTPSSPPTMPIPWRRCAPWRAATPIEHQRLHGMGEALYAAAAEMFGPLSASHLRAGRRSRGPAALSGAAPAGERRQHQLRASAAGRPHAAGEGCRRSDRSRRSPAGPASPHSAAPRLSTATG